jgi:hypothetical protein
MWRGQWMNERLQRQFTSRLPQSGVIATWVILIGTAALVVLGVIFSAH